MAHCRARLENSEIQRGKKRNALGKWCPEGKCGTGNGLFYMIENIWNKMEICMMLVFKNLKLKIIDNNVNKNMRHV